MKKFVKKKAMVQAQVIMYIFGAIMVGGILLFGVKSITSLKNQGDAIQIIKFKDTLIKSIKDISVEYNSVQVINLISPSSKYSEICFYSIPKTSDELTITSNILDQAKYILVKDVVNIETVGVSSQGPKENVFIMSQKGLEESLYVGSIEVKSDSGSTFYCVTPKANKFTFIATGLGNSARIEPQSAG